MKLHDALLKLKNYWVSSPGGSLQKIKSEYLVNQSLSRKLAVSALLSALAAALQSAGALGGVGFAISALVTLPISIAALLSVYSGLMTYFVTLFLLAVIQPSELVIFPLTTGLLGLSIGFSYRFLKRRITVVAFGALCLTNGVTLLFYVFRFPILGPVASGTFDSYVIIAIYIFSFLYCWFWTVIIAVVLKVLKGKLKGIR